MSRHVAFLRGINLGKRQIRMAELKACFEVMGFDKVKTLLASGNVAFETDDDRNLKARIDKAITDQFGFSVEVTLRSIGELEAMVESQPFKSVSSDADVKLYVMLLEAPLGVVLTGIEGDFDIVRQDQREIFIIAHKLPNGRYGEGMDKLGKQMDKGVLATTRNWNTILKAVA